MKKLCAIIMILMITIISLNTVLAADFTPSEPEYSQDSVPENMRDEVSDIWATVKVLIRMLAVGCVIFAGLRYMFASVDQKADIKQGLIYLTIGAVLVFGATLVIDLVTNATKQVLK